MLLQELLYLIDDNTDTDIYLNGELVSKYDGRDSIDEKFSEHPVQQIKTDRNHLSITIGEIDG